MAVKTYSYAKDKDKQLSPHFKVSEFRSFNDAENKLTTDVILIDESLITILEKLFNHLGCYSIIVTSGYRSSDFEKALGGNPATGQHCKGTAADIKCKKTKDTYFSVTEMLCAAQDVGFKGIGKMNTAIHVDTRASQSWFDETKGNAKVSDWYSYLGVPKPTQDKPAVSTAKSGVTKLKPGNWNVRKGPSLDAAVARVVTGQQSVTYVDIVDGFYKLRDGNYISVKACE